MAEWGAKQADPGLYQHMLHTNLIRMKASKANITKTTLIKVCCVSGR